MSGVLSIQEGLFVHFIDLGPSRHVVPHTSFFRERGKANRGLGSGLRILKRILDDSVSFFCFLSHSYFLRMSLSLSCDFFNSSRLSSLAPQVLPLSLLPRLPVRLFFRLGFVIAVIVFMCLLLGELLQTLGDSVRSVPPPIVRCIFLI